MDVGKRTGDLEAPAYAGEQSPTSTSSAKLNTSDAPTAKSGNGEDGRGQGKGEQWKEKKGTVPLCTLFFKYATCVDVAMMFFGTLAAIITG